MRNVVLYIVLLSHRLPSRGRGGLRSFRDGGGFRGGGGSRGSGGSRGVRLVVRLPLES